MLKFVNKIFQIFIDVLVFIVTLLILFSLYKLIQIKILNKPYANIFGYSVFEIATGSMEPVLKIKDLIVVKISDEVNKNDIITYVEDDNLITHRVIAVNGDEIITKGDANNSKDVQVKRENIVGRMVLVIPKGGIIREVFITPKIIISLVITLILINLCLSYDKSRDLKNVRNDKKMAMDASYENFSDEDKLYKTKSFQNLKDEVFREYNKKK